MRVEDVAKELSISTRHVFRLIEQGRLTARKTAVEVEIKPTVKEVVDVDPESVAEYKTRFRRRNQLLRDNR